MNVSTKTIPWTLLALIVTGLSAGDRTQAQQAAGPTAPQLYSHGDPTAGEQYLLEQLNCARANPVAEGQRMAAWLRNTPVGKAVVARYNTNPDAAAAQIAALPAVPPLAFSVQLLAAARAHSSDLAPHDGVGPGGAANNHEGYDGSVPYSRVVAAGYPGDFAGENFLSGADSLDTIHAGYLVDWGNPGLGHLHASLSGANTREVGIGLAAKPVGLDPQLSLVETEDFGYPGETLEHGSPVFVDAPALLLGVAYTDANGNGQYDPGEGAAGVTVTVDGGAYYTVTSASGGYALPLVNADGSFHDGPATVRMSGSALGGDQTATITVARATVSGTAVTYRANVKFDAVVNAVSGNPGGGGAGLVPPADGSTLLALSGGGMVSRAAGGKALITVQRAALDLSQPLTVAYKQKGRAVAGVDYKPLPGSVTFPAGADHATFKVKALKGGAAGDPVTLTLRLAKAVGAAVQAGGGKATVIINP